MVQTIIEKCRAQAQIFFNKLSVCTEALKEKTQAAATAGFRQAELQKEKLQAAAAEGLQRAEEKSKVAWARMREQAVIMLAVAKIQAAMLSRHLHSRLMAAQEKVQAKWQLAAEHISSRYQAVRNIWCGNQHFTFWLIPADGQCIAKKHVKKTHLKYALTGFASLVVVLGLTLGVLGHMAMQNEAQKQELALYKQTKQEQEQKIQQLQQLAEKNQKQLADLSKLEDQVRSQMEKNGAQLPPKTDASVYAGKGGASLGGAPQLNVMLEQEKNIGLAAQAKAADLQSLLGAIETENYRQDVTPSQWPTDGGYVSSSFGGRANPFSGYGSDWHPGIDIAVDYGTPVYASAAGYVQQAGWYGGYGNYIRLGHDFGYETAYGHMSRLAVRAGSFVKKGQVIGYVGSTGYSTGPHLHFEVLKNGEQVNPSSLM